MMVGFPNREASRPATIPTTPGCHPWRPSTIAGSAGQRGILEHDERLGGHGALDLLAARAQELDLRGDPARLDVARRQEQREREVRLLEPTGRVDARRETEGHVLPRRGAGAAARDLGEGARSGAGPLREEREARPHEGAVVAVERRDVRDRADRDEIEPPAQVEGDPELGPHPGADRQREPDRREPLVGKPALGSMRIEERERRQRLVRHAVVVDDDGVEPGAAGIFEAFVIARSAVAGDEEGRACGEDARQSRRRQAVAAVESVGEDGDNLGAERPQHVRHERSGGHAVRVVVPEDADALLRPRRPREAAHRLVAVLHRVGGREVREAWVEEPRRLRPVDHPPGDQDGCGRARHPESAREVDHVVARWPWKRQHRAPRDPRRDAASSRRDSGRASGRVEALLYVRRAWPCACRSTR